ncbi:DNA-binding XRE family transcriptional regulator [Gramella sp. Hel_I_59]|uniref:helix-turn-helix domain-containing protein n=1 Tax=Gramella sp. Hel_I_59 TaxID=1249978 RepID=UPI0011525864|nr:helix-turn-helix transcriptional regulator [Gramella sp. Hel_I_59]TQI70888.1 DNA-binding XRE family transcriptional regulator [Gramella sp. Hel_I_59]
MVNTEQFGTRLQRILEYYDLSAASFADKIEVGRSSISHILSGRNKPSLDFVMKVVKNFPEVELYWLLNGKGSFPPRTDSGNEKSVQQAKVDQSAQEPLKRNSEENTTKDVQINQESSINKKVKRIVFFYEDGTFEAFEN